STQISPSSAGLPSTSSSTIGQPGSGRPIEPGLIGRPGGLPTWAVVSVWPYPSRTVTPQASRTHSITSGFNGSPALLASLRFKRQLFRSCWMSRRQTVGGAQKVVTPQRDICSRTMRASKRSYCRLNTQACAFHGAKNDDHACFAHPGELKFRCTSPGRKPSQYRVERCPTG